MSAYQKSQFVSSTWRKLAACSVVSAAALLAACGQSQQASAPPTNPPAADASKPADNGKQMSVAELTGQPSDPNQVPTSSPPINPPLNQPANANAPSQQQSAPLGTGIGPAGTAGERPPAASDALASSGYAPHPSRTVAVATRDATPPPPPVYEGPIDETRFARVISVTQLTQPQRVCSNETVTERRSPGDRHQVAGTVIGAIAGGVIGHQIGGGRGRDIATVGGAVGGGLVGKEIQRSHQEGDVVTRTVQHCRTVTPGRDVVALYDVVYAYQNQNFHVKLDHDPGDRIPLPVRGIDVAGDIRH
ncbi:MAG: glycine zipper 2TM domain-containing protein [Gammaproteobacteria bacterium]|nr:MAG: glycine zipper 2TM domain-containing protein [Gammaproteobacteria bacterium]